MKLLKYLQMANIGNRSFCQNALKEKIITVNMKVISDENARIKEGKDIVKINDQLIEYRPNIYLMMNKKAGYLSATFDNFQPTVMELIKDYHERNLRIVGRLDKDTEGLLLITDDGDFIHHLTSPRHEINKTYYVEFEGQYDEQMKPRFEEGLILKNGEICKPSSIQKINNRSCRITISEGKYHQVKKMCEVFDLKVTYLKREQIGPLLLDDNLKIGQYRELKQEEIEQLMNS